VEARGKRQPEQFPQGGLPSYPKRGFTREKTNRLAWEKTGKVKKR